MQKAGKIVFAVDKGSFNHADHAGVNIKVSSQIRQMEKAGFQVELQQYEWKGGYPQIHVEKDTDFVYYRRIEPSVKLLRKFTEFKKINPNIKLIMEIPTYPFKGEETRKRSLKEKINIFIGELFLHKYVDRVALCGQVDKIDKLYGIKVIHFRNGVDFGALPVNTVKCQAEGDIHMICVSGCMYSHGYDRMIAGMKKYYENEKSPRNVYFHVVGTGEYLEDYKKLAAESEYLKDKIIFYGRKTGKELDEIYAKCNLSVAHLAIHRIGLNQISSLKSGEYAARGIPMISSTMLDICNEDTEKYFLFVPADESPIDIQTIVEFYDRVYAKENVHEVIRNLFYGLCDWDYTFSPIREYLLELH